jgi:hypothetical protein
MSLPASVPDDATHLLSTEIAYTAPPGNALSDPLVAVQLTRSLFTGLWALPGTCGVNNSGVDYLS